MDLRRSYLVPIFIGFLYFCSFLESCEGQDPMQALSMSANCMRLIGMWAKRAMPAAGECYIEQVKLNRKLRKRPPELVNLNCTMKCTSIKIGLLADDGGLDEMQIVTFVEANTPDTLKDVVYTVLASCVSLASELATPDEECSKHGLLFKCVTKGFPTIFQTCYPNSRRLVPTYSELRSVLVAGG